MNKVLSTIVVLFWAVSVGMGQLGDLKKLDAYFDALERNDKFMGSVAVSKAGTLLYSRSLGYSDVEGKRKADNGSIYRIGSISKTFTTVLVMKAVETNRLQLDQSIDVFFPKIKNADLITIRHLLQHRSGIPNFTDDLGYLTWNSTPKSEADMLALLEGSGSAFRPGAQAAYSNSNFVLLSYILERVYQQKYADLLQEHIVRPLGLKNTYYGGKINPSKNECFSYKKMGDWIVETETDSSIPLGAGGIVSTPLDLIHFSDALFGGKLLSQERLQLMRTLQDGFGLGLFQIPFYEKKGYGHTGGLEGFSSIFVHFPTDSLSFALTSNGTNMNNNDIAIAVLSSVYGKPFDIPEFKQLELRSVDLDVYLGVYASSQLPLKITITKDQATLIAQATGQPSFPLEATSKDTFKFEQADVVMEFDPAEKTLLLKQGGGRFLFTKE
jgi:CubicO group peptidase (beta-lactamase class C family)